MTRLPHSMVNAVLERVGRIASRVQERRSLPADLLESDTEYLVVIDAPGAEPGDIDVRYRDGEVTVNIERFRSFREGFSMRFPGRGLSLHASVTLPDDAVVDPESGRAELSPHGTVQVFLPKHGADSEDSVESS